MKNRIFLLILMCCFLVSSLAITNGNAEAEVIVDGVNFTKLFSELVAKGYKLFRETNDWNDLSEQELQEVSTRGTSSDHIRQDQMLYAKVVDILEMLGLLEDGQQNEIKTLREQNVSLLAKNQALENEVEELEAGNKRLKESTHVSAEPVVDYMKAIEEMEESARAMSEETKKMTRELRELYKPKESSSVTKTGRSIRGRLISPTE